MDEMRMEDYVAMKWIVTGAVVWTTTFLIVRNLLPKRSYDFCSRIVATMHAITAVYLAFLSVEDWTRPLCPLALRSSPSQMKALAVTLSYMIYDLTATIFGDNFTVDNAVHHLAAIIGIGSSLAYQKSGTEIAASMMLMEVSGPVLHTREFLKELGIVGTNLNLLVDVLFALIFSVARMVFLPYLTYVTLTADNPFLVKATAFGLQVVSAYWFYKILRMLKYKLLKKGTSHKQRPNSTSTVN